VSGVVSVVSVCWGDGAASHCQSCGGHRSVPRRDSGRDSRPERERVDSSLHGPYKEPDDLFV
jgi:hypothetical protein